MSIGTWSKNVPSPVTKSIAAALTIIGVTGAVLFYVRGSSTPDTTTYLAWIALAVSYAFGGLSMAMFLLADDRTTKKLDEILTAINGPDSSVVVGTAVVDALAPLPIRRSLNIKWVKNKG
jgi:hypothetical protein